MVVEVPSELVVTVELEAVVSVDTHRDHVLGVGRKAAQELVAIAVVECVAVRVQCRHDESLRFETIEALNLPGALAELSTDDLHADNAVAVVPAPAIRVTRRRRSIMCLSTPVELFSFSRRI